ncbi:hypothetical protein EV189_0418 [Motilibacter rhizosphaerae]|uniref:GAF domain-containing protein n=1 Tax=Motilibacter rhizosphaerae TaxID=598652 RepID=A0A4Q7NVL7_9ACTN|nr:helix-turn-helix transcriptional regulator [Motilibacter rhizosphaerae]RZS91184.1 hypothetical protein EV189_0418 [Motilibacter rhizosphaerae]
MTPPDPAALRGELVAAVSTPGAPEDRARQVLEVLAGVLAFDAAWLAVRDPERRWHTPLATRGPVDPLHRYFQTPEADAEVERLGLGRRREPTLTGELPVPLEEVRAWEEHLLPAGFRAGLAAGLFTSDGRLVGFLSLLSDDPRGPGPDESRAVAAVSTLLADGLDRARQIGQTASALGTATGGVLLTRSGEVLPLPGLPADPLLRRQSPVLVVARRELAGGGAYASFLVPDDRAPDGLVRVTALDCSDARDHLTAALLLSPPGDLRGLGELDLEVLGLLVEGTTSLRVIAGALGVSTAQAGRALEAALLALSAPSLPAAAARAVRAGLRIPPALARTRRGGGR